MAERTGQTTETLYAEPEAAAPVDVASAEAERENVQVLAADAAEEPAAEGENIVVASAEPAPAVERNSAYPDLSHIVNRLEAAADRAAVAAEEAERASLAATASANRATTALENLMEEYQE